MPIDHTEKGFEDSIEYYLLTSGYEQGSPLSYDRSVALDVPVLLRFLEATQPKAWSKLADLYGSSTATEVVKNISREIKERGILEVLRHGSTDRGVKLQFAYFKPASGLNEETLLLYSQNILTVTRQVKYTLQNENSLDMVLFLNGFPLATLELKNHLTGQTFENAVKQYKYDRSPKELLFTFKQRALVHFAVDPDNAYMTTRLNGGSTVFLPFNKGNNGGAGNPVSSGFKTAYLWEEVLQKDSLLEIVARFIHLEKKEDKVNGKKVVKETIVFPRYHQLDAVRKLLVASQTFGAGKDYLIQHSAGSGKTNTIAWLAHRLSNLHTDADLPVYHSVVVITDRKVLDKQLQDCIFQFEHQKGVVECIDKNSKQLETALIDGSKIIITTLQKFPEVAKRVEELPNRRYAVIVDEAHSSQTGTSATKLKGLLGSDVVLDDDEYSGIEQLIMQSARAKAKQSNLSFFAFTATPKPKTLEMFGQPGTDGTPQPFHLYSMRQAIEEGFILDVLQNYTTYSMFYALEKAVIDDPELSKKRAVTALARWVNLHPYNIAQKTEIIIEHFRTKIRMLLQGRAKAMVVTGSRKSAVKYKNAFDAYIKLKGYESEIKTLVAFSGTVNDENIEYTEVGMNKISEAELPEKFSSDEYQVLLVAEKYQTGFDQPLLVAMYVDKKLKGLQAVQTLSRLNRSYPNKETFILDFVNDADDIKGAFKPYYEKTEIEAVTDPNLLYTAKNLLAGFHVYSAEEVIAFGDIFFRPLAKQNNADIGRMHAVLDLAVERFENDLDKDKQDEFRHVLYSFLRLYGFLSQIVNFQDIDLERLSAYGRFLATKIQGDGGERVSINKEVELERYRLDLTFAGNTSVAPGEGTKLPSQTGIGTGGADDPKVPLSHIVSTMNEKYGANLTPEDRVHFEQLVVDMTADTKLQEQALANSLDQFSIGFDRKFMDAMLNRMERNESLTELFLGNQDMRNYLSGEIMREVYNRFREPQMRLPQ